MTSLGRGSTLDRAQLDAIKRWTREALELPLATVLVTELRCSKTECPAVETVIALLERGRQRRWSLARAVGEVRREDVFAALFRDATTEGNGVGHESSGRDR
jgi:hypothetical protein